MKVVEDPKRAMIMELLSSRELKFNDLAKSARLRSNELSYHINILSSEGLVAKKSDKYQLTDSGKVLLPYLKFIQKQEMPPTVFCAPVIVHKGRVLFIKRKKEPFKGYLEFAGGKVRKGETLIQAAVRELNEETGVHASNGRVICVADIITSKGHHFIGIYVQLDFVKKHGKAENRAVWIKKSKVALDPKILDDNKLVISRFLDGPTRYETIFYDEKENKARI